MMKKDEFRIAAIVLTTSQSVIKLCLSRALCLIVTWADFGSRIWKRSLMVRPYGLMPDLSDNRWKLPGSCRFTTWISNLSSHISFAEKGEVFLNWEHKVRHEGYALYYLSPHLSPHLSPVIRSFRFPELRKFRHSVRRLDLRWRNSLQDESTNHRHRS